MELPNGALMEAIPLPLGQGQTQEIGLVRQAQDGDLDAFEALYQEHSGRVYALCLRMTGNAGRARDLAQDTFLRVWERLASFRGESKFSSWLHQVTVNVVLSDRRTRGGRSTNPTAPETLDEGAFEHPVRTVPGQRLDLERAIAGLPSEARKVLVLHDIEGYRHDEIASMTGRAVGTCKSQLHRARKLLREALRS